jgi:hypothetical protein
LPLQYLVEPILGQTGAVVPIDKDLQLPQDLMAAALLVWQNRAISEYQGALMFNDFYGLLVNLNAPMNLQLLANQMATEEMSHAIACFSIAKHFGFDGSFQIRALQGSTEVSHANLYHFVISTFLMGEYVAFHLLADTIRQVSSNVYKETLRRILRDESVHARIGVKFIAFARSNNPDWCPYPGDQWIQEQIQFHREYFLGRDVIEPAEVKAFQSAKGRKHLPTVGIGDPERMKSLYMKLMQRDFFTDIKTFENSLSARRRFHVN